MTKSSLPKVGIVGGAGPMGGLLLFQKVIQICQQKYRCQQDADFPYIMLLNYPFAEMLKEDSAIVNRTLLQGQLNECFKAFISQEVELGAIACNTLHAILNDKPPINILHIVEQTAWVLKKLKIDRPLVLCTSTSVKSQLHRSYFDCYYPSSDWQLEIDATIDCILAGEEEMKDVHRLSCSIQDFRSSLSMAEEETLGIILGCTELSVLNEKWPLSNHGLDSRFAVVDAMQVLAEGICRSIFKNQKI